MWPTRIGARELVESSPHSIDDDRCAATIPWSGRVAVRGPRQTEGPIAVRNAFMHRSAGRAAAGSAAGRRAGCALACTPSGRAAAALGAVVLHDVGARKKFLVYR